MPGKFQRYLRFLGRSPRELPESDRADALPHVAELHPSVRDESAEDEAYRHQIEQLVGFKINDLQLYDRALSHRSLLRRKKDSRQYSNERLEFLGDSVLGFIVAEHLYLHFANEDEGFLTRLRAKLVNGEALAEAARDMDLGEAIRVSENMVQKGGRDNTSVLADAFEAVLGALYLDLGIESARDFVHRQLLDEADMDHLAVHRDNYKSLLLEFVQAKGWPQPSYKLIAEEGPSHNREFTVSVLVNDTDCGRGTANSKKKAEQQAARAALQSLSAQDEADSTASTNRVTDS